LLTPSCMFWLLYDHCSLQTKCCDHTQRQRFELNMLRNASTAATAFPRPLDGFCGMGRRGEEENGGVKEKETGWAEKSGREVQGLLPSQFL